MHCPNLALETEYYTIYFLFMVITAELGDQPLVKLKTPFRILENYENHNQTDINCL